MFSKTEEETYPSDCVPLRPRTLNYPASFKVQQAMRSGYMPGSFGLARLLKGCFATRKTSLLPPPSSSFSSNECSAACTRTGVMLPSSEQDVLFLLTGFSLWQIGLQAHYWHPTDWSWQRNEKNCGRRGHKRGRHALIFPSFWID